MSKDKQHIEIIAYEIDAENSYFLTCAVQQWNSVPNCNILFSYGTEYASEMFLNKMSVYISDNPSYIFPSEDSKYIFIQVAPQVVNNTGVLAVDTSSYIWKSYSGEEKKMAFVHALGLMIGLKQTNDINSIMHNQLYHPYWTSFSQDDKESLMNLYPLTVKSFNLTSDVSNYLSDTEYIFVPEVDSYKPYCDVLYEYEVQGASSAESYELVKATDNSAKIIFHSAGTYTIICRIKHGDLVFAETTKSVIVSSDFIIPNDDDIVLNRPFKVKWGCDANELFECSITENLFGNNQSDYTITRISRNEYSIRLLDYGYYTITFTKKNTDGSIVDTKELHVKRFYRPEMSFPDYDPTKPDYDADPWAEFDFRKDVFEIGFVCPEDMRRMTVTSYNSSYNIVVGDGTVLPERLYVKRYEKYYRVAFFYPEAVCKGPATNLANPVSLALAKGSPSVLVMPEGKNGYINILNKGNVDYRGYYAVIVPDDEVTLCQ